MVTRPGCEIIITETTQEMNLSSTVTIWEVKLHSTVTIREIKPPFEVTSLGRETAVTETTQEAKLPSSKPLLSLITSLLHPSATHTEPCDYVGLAIVNFMCQLVWVVFA